jgi:hypothetical protein
MQMIVAGSRILLVAAASLILLSGCGDAAPEQAQAPRRLRSCGELDDVEPVTPTVIGEDEYGCPVFQPVPCTQERIEYVLACGPDCEPATAISTDGDQWVVGCVGGSLGLPDGCVDPEPDPPPVCVVDPFEGGEWWFSNHSCFRSSFFAYLSCWAPCDADTATFCP